MARLCCLEVVPLSDISDVCRSSSCACARTVYTLLTDFIPGSFPADNAGFAVVEAQYVMPRTQESSS